MSYKKNVVIVTTNFANGGTERRASVLADEFVKKGYNVTYLVMNKIYPDVVYELHHDIRLVSISDFAASDVALKEKEISKKWVQKRIKPYKLLHRIAKSFSVKDKKIKRKISSLNSIISLRAFLIFNKTDIVISFAFENHEKVCQAAEGLPCKKVFSDINAPQVMQRGIDSEMLEILKNTDACIFQTIDQKKCYGKSVEKNSYVIRNPITSVLPEIYTGERKNKIVNFCRIDPQKNLILLADAFKLFSEDYPEYVLEIYGITSTERARNYKEKLLEHINDLDLSGKMKIYNAVSDVHDRIYDCRMYVSSSDYEGLSNSMVEAMAMGMPCVCTDCLGGGAREMITDGENGMLVPVNDVDALYKAMCRMVSEEGLAEKCSRNAHKVRDELSVESIVNQWLNVIEAL